MLDMIKIIYKPMDGSSLAVLRMLFGLLMMVDIIQERGGSKIDHIWGNSKDCHFPLFPFIRQLELDYMCIIYGLMWICAVFISLGYYFKTTCALFSLSYWYLILLDKSYWNNHSYLYGLLSILLMSSSANSCWSIDAFLKPEDNMVPSWNYFILRFQLFILYFYAGLKKTDLEWLHGYSMQHLGSHWIFDPFKYVFTLEQVDYFVIHVSGFLIDISSGFLLLFSCTRPFGLAINASFHLMNTRLFNIGMFPYMCLATLPIFCKENWPRKILNPFQRNQWKLDNCKSTCKFPKNSKFTIALITLYCLLQLFLPWSHFITKGYNNWTPGLYGYSWDMMVHRWDSALTVVKVIDYNNHAEYHLNPKVWTINDRWSKHADMCLQYAQCVRRNINTDKNIKTYSRSDRTASVNVSIYIDVWCSLNGRFQQRMFDPNYDLLRAIWSPFQEVEWLKPLLTDNNDWRTKIAEIEAEVHSWSNYSDVMIIADFPGLHFDNYISSDLSNVTLAVLDGEVFFEMPDSMFGLHLKAGHVQRNIPTDSFHKITTVSATPSCFMYIYFNRTKSNITPKIWGSPLAPLLENSCAFFADFNAFIKTVGKSIFNILFRVSNL